MRQTTVLVFGSCRTLRENVTLLYGISASQHPCICVLFYAYCMELFLLLFLFFLDIATKEISGFNF